MKLFCLGALLVTAATSALATSNRTFVASTGLDTNLCSRTDPCRSFTAAMAQTSAGGEVIVLDSAGYGQVSVTTSVSLVSPEGIYAGITVTQNHSGVFVDAGPSDRVLIRGLTMNGLGTLSTSGVQINDGGIVYIERVLMENLEWGVFAVQSANAQVRMDDDTAINCTEAGASFQNLTAGQKTRATIINSRFEDCFTGVEAGNRSVVSVEKSTAVGNTNVGYFALAGSLFTVDDSVATENATGFATSGSGTLGVARSLIVRNDIGVQQGTGGFLFTWSDNHLSGNTIDGTFPNTVARQ